LLSYAVVCRQLNQLNQLKRGGEFTPTNTFFTIDIGGALDLDFCFYMH